MKTQGWVKIHRKLLYSSIFSSDNGLRVWIWCLLRANHEECDIFIGLQKVHLMPGQFIFGRESAGEFLDMSPSTVRNWMDILQEDSKIDIKPTNKYSVISINNWEEYQTNDIKLDNKITTDKQQNNTDKNDKNIITNKVYGNEDINSIITELSKLTPTGQLDDTVTNNRRRAHNLIQKYGVDHVLETIKAIPNNSFWYDKVTSVGLLLKHYNAIVNSKPITNSKPFKLL